MCFPVPFIIAQRHNLSIWSEFGQRHSQHSISDNRQRDNSAANRKAPPQRWPIALNAIQEVFSISNSAKGNELSISPHTMPGNHAYAM